MLPKTARIEAMFATVRKRVLPRVIREEYRTARSLVGQKSPDAESRLTHVHRLLTEAEKIQNVRNGIIHRGEDVTEQQARHAEEVASAVLDVVLKMLAALGLKVDNNGGIEVR